MNKKECPQCKREVVYLEDMSMYCPTCDMIVSHRAVEVIYDIREAISATCDVVRDYGESIDACGKAMNMNYSIRKPTYLESLRRFKRGGHHTNLPISRDLYGQKTVTLLPHTPILSYR